MKTGSRSVLLCVFAVAASLVGCRSGEALISGEAGNIDVVESDDPEMDAAIERAQATLDQFIAALESPSLTQTYFSIKAAFPYRGVVDFEHIWLGDVSFDGQDFHGTLGNEPIYVEDLHLGDNVVVGIADVSDWMIVDGVRLLGGFTIHVLRNRMNEDERRQFDKETGLIIGDGPELP